MVDDLAVLEVIGLSKCFRIYDTPQDRLKQSLWCGGRRYYREFWALRELSFTTQRGEALAVIGRNGSGKSTLLQLICGILAPSSGSVTIRGRVAALLELGSGFNPEFSGRENVFLNASLLGLSQQQTLERLDDILAFADIGEFIDQPVKTYSSGMQLRLAFAVITQADADLLVIDEALAVGDAVFTQRCMRFIHHCRETRTLLLVSHDAASVAALTDRALWLHEGSLQQIGPTPEVMPHYVNFCQRLTGAQQVQANGESEAVENLFDLSPIVSGSSGSQHPALGGGLVHDGRQELVNYELLPMDFRCGSFTGGSPTSHQDGCCEVLAVGFEDRCNQPLAFLKGGTICRLRIQGRVLKQLRSPIIGFAVLDRLGQVVFGENTYGNGAHAAMNAEAGDYLEAVFEMEWPWLAAGEYAVTVAMASGGRLEHVNHCWLNDCVVITSTPGTRLVNGVFAPPMLRIDLERRSHD